MEITSWMLFINPSTKAVYWFIRMHIHVLVILKYQSGTYFLPFVHTALFSINTD